MSRLKRGSERELPVGLTAAVVQGGLARKLIPRLGEPRALLIGIGIGIGTLAYCGYGLAQEGWMIYAIIAVASLGGIGASFFLSGTAAALGLGIAAYVMKRWPPPEPVSHPHPERPLETENAPVA